jgi:hypothetical protein
MSNQDIMVTEPNQGFMVLNTIEQAMKVSEMIAVSSFAPKGMQNRPGDILVALQMGQELGLKPMQALQNIAVINGRPSVWGDAMLAICRNCREFEMIEERLDEATMKATCIVKRKLQPEVIRHFSKADAETAKLWKKEGPWTTYPKRMLQMRARAFALRDAFGDVLRGMYLAEEAQDLPSERTDYSRFNGTIVEGQSEPVSPDHDQFVLLRSKMADTSTEEVDICQYLKIESLDEITRNQWVSVCMMLDRKAAKQKKDAKVAELDINKVFGETAVVEELTEAEKEEGYNW